MAGSYNHITTDQGNFVSNETFVNMINNLGDAYEMAEEMYGMIWFLAYMMHSSDPFLDPAEAVEVSRNNYKDGIELAKNNTDKKKHRP